MKKPGNFRRILIINPRFQYRMIGNVFGLGVVIVGILYCANLYLFSKLNETGTSIGLPPEHVYFQFVNQQKILMNWIFTVTTAAVGLAVAIWGVMVSHRIAGPIYRICKDLQNMAENNSSKQVSFRKGDYFPELAESMNLYLKKSSESKRENSDSKKSA